MRKLSVKIAIILFAILTTIIAAISTITFLINNGRLIPLIERRAKTYTNFDIKIEDIHLNFFSGIQLKQISVQGLCSQKAFTLKCNTFTIDYKPFDLLKKRIKGIGISDVQISLNEEKAINPPVLNGQEIPPFNIKDYYPEDLDIEDLAVNNINVKITTGGYAFSLTEMDVQVKEVQMATPVDISMSGNFSISDHADTTSPSLLGKIGVETKYSLSDDELIIIDGSYLLANGLGRFSINGKVCSITSLPEVNCKVSLRGLPMSNITGLLSSFNLMDFPSLILGGECDLNLSVQGDLNEIKIDSNILIKSLSTKIEKRLFKADMLEIPIEATLFPSDTKSTIKADGKLVVHKGHLEVPNGQITDIDLPTTFTLDYPNQITLSSDVIDGELRYNDTHYTISQLISNIRVNVTLKHPEDILFQTQFYTSFSGPALITGNIDTKESIVRDITLNIHNINGNTLSEALKPIFPEKYKDWSLNGNMSINTTLDHIGKEDPQKMTAVTELSFSKLKFASPDYDYFGEKIDGHITINTIIDNNFNKFSFHTIGTFSPFLIQLREFTTDMRNRKTDFSIKGNYDAQKKHITEIESILSWDNMGVITGMGDILHFTDDPHFDINLAVKELSNSAIFETFVKDMVEYSNPVLFNSSIDGESNSSFSIKGPKNDLTIKGHVDIKKLNLEYGDISIEDFSIDLPISMAYPRSKTPILKEDIPDAEYGTIQLKKLSYGPLEIEDIKINPVIISNNFFVRGPFNIPVFDGTVNIRDVSVENMINNDRKIKFEFQLNNINLEDMTTAYMLTPFEGTLSSSVMSFQQEEQRLFSKDEISIKLFGGDITISDLTLSNFLSSMMEIGLSAKVEHLDLGKMSNTYREWGNITGIINGQINDFKLVAGEPSSFEMEMKTEKSRGIKQIVSTKFLKNFVPGIGNVLDKVGFTNYKYAVMGLHARLENDYIKLRGAVRENGKELFMKGAGMKRLEIVFPNVNKRVPFKRFLNSFKGMLGADTDGTQVQFK